VEQRQADAEEHGSTRDGELVDEPLGQETGHDLAAIDVDRRRSLFFENGACLCRANMQTQGSARAATGMYRPLG